MLAFRPIAESDLPDLLRWRADPDVVRFFDEDESPGAKARWQAAGGG